MSPPFCVWITPHIHYLNETEVWLCEIKTEQETNYFLPSIRLHSSGLSHVSLPIQRPKSMAACTQYKCMQTYTLTCRHVWEDPRLPPAIMHVKPLISGQNLWCQNDESILRAYENTKAAAQGQIYTGGYLRVPSGLTYSSDASTKNTQRHEWWFKRGIVLWACVPQCDADSWIKRNIHMVHTW